MPGEGHSLLAGANHSHSLCYGADLPRRLADEDAVSCIETCVSQYKDGAGNIWYRMRYYAGPQMNVMTLKLPDDLNAALKEVSRKRGLSKSAVVREALEHSLLAQGVVGGAAERWVAQWQGRLKLPEASDVEAADPRLAQLLAKHVR